MVQKENRPRSKRACLSTHYDYIGASHTNDGYSDPVNCNARVGACIIDSLQLNFIHVIPSMPAMITVMLRLGLV